jgi:hypothetical protein
VVSILGHKLSIITLVAVSSIVSRNQGSERKEKKKKKGGIFYTEGSTKGNVAYFLLLTISQGKYQTISRKRKYGPFYMIEHQLLTVQAVY